MSVAAPPPARRLGRDEVVRVGRESAPWAYLPLAVQAIRQRPDDLEIIALAALHWAKLGLRTPALATLDLLPAAAREDPDIKGLAKAASALPDDRVDPAGLESSATRNIRAMRDPSPAIRAAHERWRAESRAWTWLRAADGQFLRVRGPGEIAADRWEWRALADHRAMARAFGSQLAEVPHPGPPLIVVEGLDPPWLALEVAARTPRHADGFQPRLVILQADPVELIDGLAQADLAELLAHPRVTLIVGDDASERLGDWLRARLDQRITGVYAPLVGVRTRAAPPAERTIAAVHDAQAAEHEALAAEVARLYAGLDRAHWRRRFLEASRPGGQPLRVLVPTSRYSTYIQHASRDLVEAFKAAGARAELLIEPDDHARLSSLAYLRLIRDLKPDLVVLINWMRASLGPWLPRELPFVCWIQDAMPHQFDRKAGEAQGDLDFLVGHLHPELFDRFGFPRARSMSMPVVASARKFHDRPPAPDAARAHECEIALVSHHSETPDEMHARLCGEAGDARITRVLEALRPRVEAMAQAADTLSWGSLAGEAREAWTRAAGADPDDVALARVYRQYALPMADRMLRHEAVGWARRICDRRGWRLALYGRGWERRADLRDCARGEVTHDDALRCVYRSAAVTLHVSLTAIVHQRVMECALSGGLPACRLTFDAILAERNWAARQAVRESAPDAREPATGRAGYATADHPALLAYAALRQRLGLEASAIEWIGEARERRLRAGTEGPSDEARPSYLLGDLAELSFRDEASLEAMVERAVTRPTWRQNASRLVADRVRARLTHDVLVRRIVDLVAGDSEGG